MADNKKVDNKKETKSPEVNETAKDASRNALFILISLLIIVFLIGLALIINRGLNNNPVNTTADNTGLINSDTNPPSNTTNNITTNTTTPTEVPPVPPTETTPTPAPEPTPSSEGSVGTAASTESSDSGNSAVLPTGHTEDGYKRSLSNQSEIEQKNLWFPTNYNIGDIPSNQGKYTVQYGDTLWWIAQGHYGDPFQWTKIESANFNLIGYLPDGEHALIFPGQVFDLP